MSTAITIYHSDNGYTTDISNKEQAVIVLRWVSNDFEVNEEFLGLYNVPTIDVTTLTMAAKDTLCRINLPMTKLRGQCYDGQML